MLDTTNEIVQALVWTTLAGLLYAVWLRSETTSRYKLDLSFYWQQVVEILSWLWVLLAIGLVISLLIFAWPRPSPAASIPGNQCISALASHSVAYPANSCPGQGEDYLSP